MDLGISLRNRFILTNSVRNPIFNLITSNVKNIIRGEVYRSVELRVDVNVMFGISNQITISMLQIKRI